jgi:hypothetical protein
MDPQAVKTGPPGTSDWLCGRRGGSKPTPRFDFGTAVRGIFECLQASRASPFQPVARQPMVEIHVLKQLQSGRDCPKSMWRSEVHRPLHALVLHHSKHQSLVCMFAQLSAPPHVLSSTPRGTQGRYFLLLVQIASSYRHIAVRELHALYAVTATPSAILNSFPFGSLAHR